MALRCPLSNSEQSAPKWLPLLVICVIVGAHFSVVWSAEFLTPSQSDVHPGGIPGLLVIAGGGTLPEEIFDRFFNLAGGESARLVVIPTASNQAGQGPADTLTNEWKAHGFEDVTLLHTLNREIADTESFTAPLRDATAVWFVGGQQSRIAKAYVGTRVEQELNALLERGGVIGGTSAGAAVQSRLMIAGGNPMADVMQGLNLLPGGVIDQHFKVRNRQPRLTGVLRTHPGYFGVGIDEGTAIVVQGRTMNVIGESTVTVCFSKSANRNALQYELSDGAEADLTALRRAAIARAGTAFPPDQPVKPHVAKGTLFIVGGGATADQALWKQFVNLAGGETSSIVIIPTASPGPDSGGQLATESLQDAGAKSVTVLHTSDRAEADSEEFIAPLKTATAVWFTGGRQWRIVDAYENTRTFDALHDLLARGGVIGGSSAGATIQGAYLARGNPLGNQQIMAEGYEVGFGFLPGTAIDQHFSQRKRLTEMESLKKTFPQLLGIGIDESTALIVKNSTVRVIGEHDVYFFDGNTTEDAETPGVTKVASGQQYDLIEKRLVEPNH